MPRIEHRKSWVFCVLRDEWLFFGATRNPRFKFSQRQRAWFARFGSRQKLIFESNLTISASS
jgi:hypothetical protein